MGDPLVWSSDVAWVDTEAGMAVALLPDGPIIVLTGAGAALERMQGEFTVEGLIADAVEARAEEEEALRAGVHAFVDALSQSGILVSARGRATGA